jgi:hypothetical protein
MTLSGNRVVNVIKLMRWMRKAARIGGPMIDVTHRIYHPAASTSEEIIQQIREDARAEAPAEDKPLNKKDPVD